MVRDAMAVILGGGKGSIIQDAMIEQNVSIGRNVRVVNQVGRKEYQSPEFSIREGIVVVHRNAALPDNTVV